MNSPQAQALSRKALKLMNLVDTKPEISLSQIVALLGEMYHCAIIVKNQPYEGMNEQEDESKKEIANAQDY